MVLGVVAAIAAFLADRYVLMWTSPVLLGLALSSFLSLHTSRVRSGVDPDRERMLQIPEEAAPPPVITRAAELRRQYVDQAENRRLIEVMFRASVPVYGLERASVFIPARVDRRVAA